MDKDVSRKVEPHLDIADMYTLFGYTQDDFFSDKDLPVTEAKLRQARVAVLGTTLYFDESFVETNYYDGVIDFFHWYEELFEKSDLLYQITSGDELNGIGDGIACIYTIEGFQCLRRPSDIDHFYQLGVRMFGPTWSDDNAYACGRESARDTGFSKKGVRTLRRIRDKAVIMDIAHLSRQSVRDLANLFSGMIVSSHSNVRTVQNSPQNLTDDEIELIVERGGVVSLFPLISCTGPNGTFDELYRHLDYIGERWGEDYIGVSSDIYPLDEYPFIENYQDILVLNGFEQYLRTRLEDTQIEKIFYGNWMRVLREAL